MMIVKIVDPNQAEGPWRVTRVRGNKCRYQNMETAAWSKWEPAPWFRLTLHDDAVGVYGTTAVEDLRASGCWVKIVQPPKVMDIDNDDDGMQPWENDPDFEEVVTEIEEIKSTAMSDIMKSLGDASGQQIDSITFANEDGSDARKSIEEDLDDLRMDLKESTIPELWETINGLVWKYKAIAPKKKTTKAGLIEWIVDQMKPAA